MSSCKKSALNSGKYTLHACFYYLCEYMLKYGDFRCFLLPLSTGAAWMRVLKSDLICEKIVVAFYWITVMVNEISIMQYHQFRFLNSKILLPSDLPWSVKTYVRKLIVIFLSGLFISLTWYCETYFDRLRLLYKHQVFYHTLPMLLWIGEALCSYTKWPVML